MSRATDSRRLMCPGCPAASVTENIVAHPELSRRQSGAIMFCHLTARRTGPIRRLMDAGVTTHEALGQDLTSSLKNESPEYVMHGDLSESDIINRAIECMLRVARGECTLADA
jgi:hypothetical protein